MAETAIALVDNTLPEPEPDLEPEILGPSTTRHSRFLAKRLTRNSVRQNLAKRKYAKYQRGRYDADEQDLNRENSLIRRCERTGSIGDASSTLVPGHVEPDDGADSLLVNGDGRDGDTEVQSEIDVLYENQRGWWFFGIPYYSDKSLLNLDPTPWVTKNLEVSPVDVTNAQPPDPTWEWAWKTWYIDMSYDVDEEGWQYSFSFASRFAWHGTHPWHHSFVRRRRWIRKRVKRTRAPTLTLRGVMTDDLSLAFSEDYLTARTGSKNRELSLVGTEGISHTSTALRDVDEHISPDEITNVVVLMKAVKRATLDREKIEAVKAFVYMAGEELVYLAEKVKSILFYCFKWPMLIWHRYPKLCPC